MICDRFLKIFVLDSVLNVRGFSSDERKRCFQTLETMLPMGGNDASDEWKDGRDFELPYTGLVDRGDYKITGLHPVFCARDF